jgi:enamine deaminase RidA (YjgF/YER057c/UK114 family)
VEWPVSGHRVVNPAALAKPVGFAHAVVAGHTVYLGGQTAQGTDGVIVGTTITRQFDVAAGNVVTALAAAGGSPEHLVSLVIYVTDMAEYRAARRELAPLYRRHFGRYYPAMALIGVAELLDPAAKVELMGVAVITPPAGREP